MVIALETVANVLGRPFGLHFFFERTHRWTDWQRFDWGIEAWSQPGSLDGNAYRNWQLFAGPFQLSASRTYRAA